MIRPPQMLALIAAGIALIGSGLWLLSRHVADTALDGSGPVLPLKQDMLNSVVGLRIFKGDGSHTTLARDAAHWTVTERGYPADSGEVRKLLLDLSALQTEEQKTADPALYSVLGVEDPVGGKSTSTGIEIDINSSKLTLIVGKTSGTQDTYVRVAGQAQSLLVTPQLAPDADPRHWLDRAVLDIAPDEVTAVAVHPQTGPDYAVSRSPPGALPEFVISPIPKGRELADAAAQAPQAGALAALQLDDVRKAGTAAGVAHASVHTRDGLVLAITGYQEAEQRYVNFQVTTDVPAAQPRARDLNARLAGWEFEIPSYRYDALFQPLEQLLKPKPTAPAAKSKTLPHSPVMSGVPNKVTPLQSH
jgi:hypothetical protein